MNTTILIGSLIEDIEEMTLAELAGICACEAEWIVGLVEEGILDPHGHSHAEWRFNGACLMRARTALRLHQDLNINIAGIALVIDLMEEMNELQARLRVLQSGS